MIWGSNQIVPKMQLFLGSAVTFGMNRDSMKSASRLQHPTAIDLFKSVTCETASMDVQLLTIKVNIGKATNEATCNVLMICIHK